MTEPKLRGARVRPLLGSTVSNGSTIHCTVTSAWAWDGVLALLTLIWSYGFIRLFFPGRVNVDIGNQYRQALGEVPVTDWHPPVMSAVWRVLIDVTGQAGSLLVLQVGMLALAAWLVGVLIHRIGAPRWVSLLGPAIMATPWVLSQMTTLWKDTQMGVAMLLAVLLLVFARFAPRPGMIWAPWIVAIFLLVYALGLRKNALFAIVPIAVYFGFCLVRRFRRRGDSPRRAVLATAGVSVLVLALLGGGVKATDAAISSVVEVEPTGQISQIFLDDVMFSVPEAELQVSDAPEELKDHISSARDKCLEMGEIWDAYWNCYGRGETGKAFSPIAYQDELKDLWLSEVVTHPVRYAEYRAAVFSYYFFSSKLEYWEADWNGDATKVGYGHGSVKADYIFKPYVEDFALGTFPMLFKPWFWTLLAALLLGLGLWTRRKGRPAASEPARPRAQDSAASDRAEVAADRTSGGRTLWPEVTMLATSALCYIFGYFPIVPANHFRYTFWPALAVTVATVLVVAMWRSGRLRGGRPTATVGERSGRAGRPAVATPPTRASSESET
ncbi:hypothetical protein ACH82I_15370 [Brevibacterium sp. GP-SGM9]|uniref:hypothetical protein n=1 Tax=Brevibacterium sp. GP-SGM9 TaxID=3376990 RepID=UPI0039A5B60B